MEIISSIAYTGTELFIQHGIPWLGKKALEMGRYASEAYREPGYQKKLANKAKQLSQKGVNYAINALSTDLLNQAATKIRPKGNWKTNRKDLD